MTTRILPPDEWYRLEGTLLEIAWPTFHPQRTTVIVVERDGSIVGCVAKLTIDHMEGVWIAPEERGHVSVGRRLLDAVRSECGGREVWMMALNDESKSLCERLGDAILLECDHFAVKVM